MQNSSQKRSERCQLGNMDGANNIKIDIRDIEVEDGYGVYWFMLKPNNDISEYSSGHSISSENRTMRLMEQKL